MKRFALSAQRIFDGTVFHDNAAVVIEGTRIVDLVPRISAQNLRDLGEGILAPGFIDVQVNGGGGALMNDNPTLNTVRTIAESHRKHGTTGLLPTVITDSAETIEKAISAVVAAHHCPGVLGIHIEGPFLDPDRKGAHDDKFIRAPSDEDIARLAKLNVGTTMVTLAPNKVKPEHIAQLTKAHVKVSLGHSDASFAQATAALSAGATAFTHLFNAMSQLTPREPGMVGAALRDNRSFLGVIADGHHVHDATLKLAFAATSHDRFMLISDAMPPAAGGPQRFNLQGRTVTRRGNRLTLDDGTLAGSCLTMDEAVRYAVNQLNLPLASALQMAGRNPARFLGRADLGVIAPNACASLVHLTNTLKVAHTWIDGS